MNHLKGDSNKVREENVKYRVSRISTKIRRLCHEELAPEKMQPKKPCITKEIIDLMEPRRTVKGILKTEKLGKNTAPQSKIR